MTDNWHNERNNVIENWHINSSRKDDRELKATKRPITIAQKDNKKDFDERKDYSHVLQKMIEVKKERNSIEIIQKKKLDIIDEDKDKGIERQLGNSTLTNSKETLRKILDIEKDRKRKRHDKESEKELQSSQQRMEKGQFPRKIISYHILYNKSWAYKPWLRHVASPNCKNFVRFLKIYIIFFYSYLLLL